MEAEEIIKQLDIEPAEEMPSSILTSTEGTAPCHAAPIVPQRLQINSDTTIEQGEIVTEADMPPLTGTTTIALDLYGREIQTANCSDERGLQCC